MVTERESVTVETQSAHDLYLELHRGDALVTQNDDGGRDLDARIELTLDPGTYRVVVRPYSAALGAFALRHERGPPAEAQAGSTLQSNRK